MKLIDLKFIKKREKNIINAGVIFTFCGYYIHIFKYFINNQYIIFLILIINSNINNSTFRKFSEHKNRTGS
jgi:hypothetical protein